MALDGGRISSSSKFQWKGDKWIPGLIIEQSGPYSFKVKTHLGLWRHHIDQLKHFIIDDTVSQDIMEDAVGGISPNCIQMQSQQGIRINGSPDIASVNSEGGMDRESIIEDYTDTTVASASDLSLNNGLGDQGEFSDLTGNNPSTVAVRRSSRLVKPVVKLNL